jgi:hypothetical protein
MGIDFDKLRKSYNRVMNKKSSVFWKPSDGEQVIRIIPTADGDPFKQYWFHYGITRGGFLSPKRNFGEDDPLDQFVRGLFDENTEDSIKMAKSLMAKQRFFTPVIVRGEEDQGVRLWGFGKQAYQRLFTLCTSKEYGDITDVDKGLDLKIVYGKPPGAQFPQTTIDVVPSFAPDPKSGQMTIGSKASDDPNKIQEWLSSIPDFDEVFERKTPQEVQVLLDQYLAGPDDEGRNDVVKFDNSQSVKSTSSDVEQKFAELMAQ